MSEKIDEYRPIQGIIVHHSDNGGYYLESHKINEDGSFGNGKPLMKETMIDIFESITISSTDRLQFKGIIPDNILLVRNSPGNTVAIWTTEPQKINMKFTKNVGVKDGLFSVPALLWSVSGQSLSVFALKKTKISKNTKIYQLPLPNLNDGGGVCWGTGKWPSSIKYYEDFIEQVMMGFWESRFSHRMKPDQLSIWKPLRNKNIPYPNKSMVLSGNSSHIKKKLGL